ncbi:hypothetical protein KM043_001208 [Ampulex compressa]|nr:hypothetical protein KM043_001208 [Ampulex compressa]
MAYKITITTKTNLPTSNLRKHLKNPPQPKVHATGQPSMAYKTTITTKTNLPIPNLRKHLKNPPQLKVHATGQPSMAYKTTIATKTHLPISNLRKHLKNPPQAKVHATGQPSIAYKTTIATKTNLPISNPSQPSPLAWLTKPLSPPKPTYQSPTFEKASEIHHNPEPTPLASPAWLMEMATLEEHARAVVYTRAAWKGTHISIHPRIKTSAPPDKPLNKNEKRCKALDKRTNQLDFVEATFQADISVDEA